MDKRLLGLSGEEIACRALRKAGLRIVERNFRCAAGEIDIIAREKKTLVFVEVKTRTSDRFGRPAEAVGRTKQMHIFRTATIWLAQQGFEDVPIRFDIVEVLPEGVHHIRSAFDASGLIQ